MKSRGSIAIFFFLCGSLLFSSCGLKLNKYAVKTADSSFELAPIFHQDKTEFVFDMHINYGKNKQNSGILAVVIDSLLRDNYRTVFMAKAGIKLFDFSFTNDQFTINHIIPEMDKKIVKNILEKDLRLMLDDKVSADLIELAADSTNCTLFRNKKGKLYYYHYVNSEGRTYQIDKGKKKRSFVRMHIKYNEYALPQEILIDHQRIPFSMRLNSLSSK